LFKINLLKYCCLGEVSIEFKREYRGVGVDERDGSSSLPRKQRFNVLHQKQPSLPGWYSALGSQFLKAYN